jgi:hypothetical protein
MSSPSLLERLVIDRAAHTLTNAMSLAIEKAAEEIAKDVLANDTFRRAIRGLVERRSQEILDELMRPGPERRRAQEEPR